ncbi:MAG TPA: hypothetical protein VF692_13030 [Pyrinomonadaceae bacterium]
MPKSKKPNKPGEENRTAWRTPVKLPATATVEPMKSLYIQNNSVIETEPQVENAETIAQNISARANAETESSFQEISNEPLESKADEPKKQSLPGLSKPNINTELAPSAAKKTETEKTPTRIGEAEFLRLLKTEKMDFYSLAEILRGSSMALYCVLYSESLAKGENRCQIRQTDLMMRAEINNPATLYKQERWLTVLGLINKSVRLGNHSGASYEVRPLETLPLPNFILEQFDGYLSELVK